MGTSSTSLQTALVTGASRGIGAAIALQLAQQGFQVCGTATSEEGAARINQSLAAYPGCHGVVLQVNDVEQLQAVVDRLVEQTGGLHVLVNNAGITRDTLAMRMKDSDWDDVIDTNLKAVFRLCRAVVRPMMKQRFGRIINITSVVGATGNPGQANYAAAKAGVIGFTRSSAKELASRGITVNAVAPGFIATDMTKDLQAEALLAAIPLGRYGEVAEVAGAVRFLAADPASAYITGQVLQVDGGMLMG
ncbi:MAG TPA: 3-oxoacyl-ACP reductase [Synechococcales bacterium UBA8138]|nr:3-oxoacyl-ACP reductase [Synechococcales bacterium UBA8138]